MNYLAHLRPLLVGLTAFVLTGTAATRANAEAKLLVDAATGQVLYAENATHPWYPASLTKLMTTYTTLREIQQGKITLNTLITMTPEAAAQQPSKMGLPVGTKLTIDNALKMMLVKSANDIAVAIAQGVAGSIPKFAALMNANAARLGMTQSHFVNPNGLPAEGHETSARDLAILTRALITQFPQYGYLFQIHSIRYGNRIIRNYNHLLDRYPGTDGMKTGFICASGYNLIATATHHGHRLIAIVLGAYSGHARMQEAAQLLQDGFKSGALSWLSPSLGTVDELKPIDAQPPDLRPEVCGPHRHRMQAESDADDGSVIADDGDKSPPGTFMLSSLRAPEPKYVLPPPVDTEPPIVVFTGPAEHPDAPPSPRYHRRARKGVIHHHHHRARTVKRGRYGRPREKSAQR